VRAGSEKANNYPNVMKEQWINKREVVRGGSENEGEPRSAMNGWRMDQGL
jgi:hypothetical protein